MTAPSKDTCCFISESEQLRAANEAAVTHLNSCHLGCGTQLEWLTVHPRTPGLFWVSVEPSGRSPAPWVVLEPVFQIMITPAGDVFELCTIGGVAQFKEEPIYTTATIPKMGIGVKYRSAVESLPSDPWARKGRKATP